MDPRSAARFHNGILEAASPRYGIAPDASRPLDGFEGFLYEFDRPDGGNPDHPRCAWFMRGRRERIAADVPFIDLPWASLVQYLE